MNETVTWANNSRLLTLAVPEGTPPPGGWPVLMDLLVVDYPTRLPSDRGLDKETAKQICGLDGGTFPTSDGSNTDADPVCCSSQSGLWRRSLGRLQQLCRLHEQCVRTCKAIGPASNQRWQLDWPVLAWYPARTDIWRQHKRWALPSGTTLASCMRGLY